MREINQHGRPNNGLQRIWPSAECFRWCVLRRRVEYNECSPAKPAKPLSPGRWAFIFKRIVKMGT
jgi:hypothetical protein